MSALQTIVVESNSVFRESLKRLLESGGYKVHSAVGLISALHQLSEAPKRLTIVLSSAKSETLLDDVREIKAAHPAAQIVVLGGHRDMVLTLDAIRSGANACLDDATTPETFFKTLDLASHGLAAFSVGIVAEISEIPSAAQSAEPVAQATPFARQLTSEFEETAEKSIPPSFSPRESAILQLLQEGAPNKLIARQLRLTEATVKVHLKSILRKIRVKNRTQAAVWAMTRDPSETASSHHHVETGAWNERSSARYHEVTSSKN